MSVNTQRSEKVWREEEIEALPENGLIHEVVAGELRMSPKNNFEHEKVCAELFESLYVKAPDW